MVGYMRRYAPAFENVLEQLGGISKVLYARIRGMEALESLLLHSKLTRLSDMIGPNSTFVDQSGSFPKKYSDFREEDTEDVGMRTSKFVREGLIRDCDITTTDQGIRILSLGRFRLSRSLDPERGSRQVSECDRSVIRISILKCLVPVSRFRGQLRIRD
jgi:hypothetical protein